jgi:hypothetical protein
MTNGREVLKLKSSSPGDAGTIDPSTVAWVDQRAARLTERTSLNALLAAWNQDGSISDVDLEELLLGRLVVATAIVAKGDAGADRDELTATTSRRVEHADGGRG